MCNNRGFFYRLLSKLSKIFLQKSVTILHLSIRDGFKLRVFRQRNCFEGEREGERGREREKRGKDCPADNTKDILGKWQRS